MLKTSLKCTVLVLILVLICGLAFSVDAQAEETAHQTYTLTYGIDDDPNTAENETAISMELVSLYGEQANIHWRLAANEECSFLLALFMNQTRIVIYTSELVRPLNAHAILDNTGVTYYYYLESTRCYTFPIEITVNGETFEGYFRETYPPEMFVPKEPQPDNENKVPNKDQNQDTDKDTTTNENTSTNVTNVQLDALYDYMDLHTKQIRALYIIAILTVVFLVFVLVVFLYNLNKVKADRVAMERELERFVEMNNELEKKVKKHANKRK